MLTTLSYDPVGFAGSFHFILLHLPIGALTAVWVVEIVALIRRKPAVGLRRALLAWAALTALASVATGWMLAATTEHGPIIGRHKAWAIASASTLLIATAADLFGKERRWCRITRVLALVAATALITITGHLGGSSTHGRGFLGRHAPPWFASIETAIDAQLLPPAKPVEDADGALVGAVGAIGEGLTVAGILQRTCVECHGPDKQKGDLRLDTESGILSVVDAPDVAYSELTRRVLLPADHDDAMPTKGERLTEAEVWTLIRWVQNGADIKAIGKAAAAADKSPKTPARADGR